MTELCRDFIQITLPGGRWRSRPESFIFRCTKLPSHDGDHSDGERTWKRLGRPGVPTSGSGAFFANAKPYGFLSAADERDQLLRHMMQHAYPQQGDCSPTREMRDRLASTVELAMQYRDDRDRAEQKLDAIAHLEVHGREFVDAAQLYEILGLPIPDPIDHAANIRARAEDYRDRDAPEEGRPT